jgi:uncharacterized DUF497 family protein
VLHHPRITRVAYYIQAHRGAGHAAAKDLEFLGQALFLGDHLRDPAVDDSFVLTLEDTDAHGESRYVSLGRDAFGRILVVVWTEREDSIRLISARKASPGEARHYPG